MVQAAPGSKNGSTGRLNEAGLRAVFDKFDVDKSGSVDTAEMTKMVKQLKLDLSAAQIKQLMVEADPDKSGSIEYSEFVAVLKRQLEAGGGGGLSNVVTEASSAFGWLNPLSWFASDEPAAPPAAATPSKGTAAKAKAASAAKALAPSSSLSHSAAKQPAPAAGPPSAAPTSQRARSASPGSKRKGAAPKAAATPKAATPKGAASKAATPKGKASGGGKGSKGVKSKAQSERRGLVAPATPGQQAMRDAYRDAVISRGSPSSVGGRSSPGSLKPQRIKVTQAAVREEYMRQAQQIRNDGGWAHAESSGEHSRATRVPLACLLCLHLPIAMLPVPRILT
jgi:hypothetical protein